MPLPRIFYVPNEDGDFRQTGIRRPLADLQAAGLIGDVDVHSLQWRIRNGGDPESHRQELLRRVRDFRPDVLLLQHVGATGLSRAHCTRLRAAVDGTVVYHEADPYGRFRHRLPAAAREVGRVADVVFTVGSGRFRENFLRAGARDVRYAHHCFDPERFPRRRSDGSERRYDVVVVAHRNSPRIPLHGLPDWKNRIRFVTLLQERFAGRLGIYGRGWEGEGALGPIDFSRQDEAIRSGWVSANWDHYASEPDYFSNRLPISLAAGSIHATTRHVGYDALFDERYRDRVLHEPTQERLLDAIDDLLARTGPEERLHLIRDGQELAYGRFRQDDQLVRFLNADRIRVDPGAARRAWNVDRRLVDLL
ncbi:MAG: hypothetical protein P8Z68_06220 [Kineosporiaceae bacterium]